MAFVFVLAVLNLPLWQGQWNSAFAFLPRNVAAGEWWRLLSHPFVHVSWYHLLLDGAGFLLLYSGLHEARAWKRLACVLACGGCSLAAVASAAPELRVLGFCGLSGIAHGLMAFSAVEMLRDQDCAMRRIGLVAFGVVLLKSAIEAVTGNVVLSSFHFGLMGTPIAVSHAGGVIGGLLISQVTTSPPSNSSAQP